MANHRSAHRTLFLLALVLLAGLLTVAVMPSTAPPAQAAGRPNIVLITTDDMTRTDLRWMPKTRRHLRDAGVEVSDFLSNHPLCCPARGQIFTGQYAHNNGVHSNLGDYGGYAKLIDKGNHVGSWLRRSGYKTAFVGKHMNGWPAERHHQPGWTVFDPYLGPVYNPYGLNTFNNGRPRHYSGIHTSDLVGDLTVRYVNRFSRSGRPFFIWASQVAPHDMTVKGEWVPPVPAQRHRTLYPDAVPPSLSRASFNEADVSDKPGYLQRQSEYAPELAISKHRARIRSLRSVDDQVARIVRVLRDRGELSNTYIFFTSDNGYLLGEHRWVGKNVPYEEALQVPLLARGPALPRGVTRHVTFGLVDLAPTFAALARTTPGRTVDGRSMIAALRRGEPGYDDYLVQGAESLNEPWWWRGVRSEKYTYIRYFNEADKEFEELYDRAVDPQQLDNLAYVDGYQPVVQEHAARLAALQDCSGATCYLPPPTGP